MPVSPVIEITFALSAVVILLSSMAVVLIKNPVRATLVLILSFLPTSLVYILLQASFVGILQILVYAGAIMMLFTFVIMMINPSPKDGESPIGGAAETPYTGIRGALIGLAFVGLAGAMIIPLVYSAASRVSVTPVSKLGFGDLASIAALLFEDPANNPLTVSFELISFLILVGIIAALNFSRRKSAPADNQEDSITTRPTEALPVVKREAALDRK
ncbi:MAG: NADH-quinone oxidoreductase subunit J [Fibrobacterota bacterium]|nr:NADH-quinone oxidoreductase subunit J [Fibrobacterota bacterium]